jgi:hypothetical protein
MNTPTDQKDAALNDFLNRLTDELRLHGSQAKSVEDLLQQTNQHPEWKVPAEAAVMLRRAYENDHLPLPTQPSAKSSPPAELKKRQLSLTQAAIGAILVGVLVVGLLIVVQLPWGGNGRASNSSISPDAKGSAAELMSAAKQLQTASKEVANVAGEVKELKKNAEDSLKKYEELTNNSTVLAAVYGQVLARSDPNKPKRFNVSFPSGMWLRPISGGLPDVSITETYADHGGVHVWGLGK